MPTISPAPGRATHERKGETMTNFTLSDSDRKQLIEAYIPPEYERYFNDGGADKELNEIFHAYLNFDDELADQYMMYVIKSFGVESPKSAKEWLMSQINRFHTILEEWETTTVDKVNFGLSEIGSEMEFKIINTDVVDNAVADHDGNYQPSEISVLVEIEIDRKVYYLDFQTTSTHDYGAYSSDLAPYEGTDSYDALADMFDGGTDDDQFHGLIAAIKKAADVQQKWTDYITETYIVDDDYFGGMDANSEINRMRKLDE